MAMFVAGVFAGVPPAPRAAAPIRVMLLDGANNHDWKSTSPVIRKVLDEAAMFKTTTVTVDNAGLNTFTPDWSQYDVVVLNYNTGIGADAPEWLPETRRSFERYVSSGGGLVSVHAADNGFAKWFFFSSRRRHTRYIGDWSSDVCSSDLRRRRRARRCSTAARSSRRTPPSCWPSPTSTARSSAAPRSIPTPSPRFAGPDSTRKIGRASCREGVPGRAGPLCARQRQVMNAR